MIKTTATGAALCRAVEQGAMWMGYLVVVDLHTVEPSCQVPMLIGKRAASWALHIQGRLQKLTTPINFMTSRTPSARAHMDSFN